MIKVIYNKVCGRCVQSEPLTSGMVGQPIELEYSSDFDGLTLTAVFTNGKTTVDVLNPDNQCVIPHEVLDTVGTVVKVGIYAVRGNELVIPTVYATIGIVLKGADPSGDVSADPTLPVWAQIKALIGDLDDLDTEAKNNLVAAINEAAQTGSGGSASMTMRVDGGYIQYSTDNGKTWVNLIAVADLKGDKGDKGTDGTNGITPHIGGNGNWYIGSDDTGKPSRGEQGAKGADGTNGKDGTDGHTPVKGTDYWTASDKAEIVDDTKNAIDLSSYAKLKDLLPLTGTTIELTPAQVQAAVLKGQPVVVRYNDEDFGALKFTNFNIAESLQTIVSQTIVRYNLQLILCSLTGNANSGSWDVQFAELATRLMLDDFAAIFIIDYSNPAADDYTNAVAAFDDKKPVYLRKGNIVLPMTGYDNAHCYFGGTTSAYLPAGYVNAVYAHIGQNGENYYWYDYKVAIEAAGLFSADAGEYFTSTNVMGQLQEAGAKFSTIPTDEHINNLINTALGVIENADY